MYPSSCFSDPDYFDTVERKPFILEVGGWKLETVAQCTLDLAPLSVIVMV